MEGSEKSPKSQSHPKTTTQNPSITTTPTTAATLTRLPQLFKSSTAPPPLTLLQPPVINILLRQAPKTILHPHHTPPPRPPPQSPRYSPHPRKTVDGDGTARVTGARGKVAGDDGSGGAVFVAALRPDIADLESKLSELSKKQLTLQQNVDDLASKHPYNPDEDYADAERKLRSHLETFLDTARSFNTIYTKEIRPWTHMMEVPQLHGFGPAANRLLEAYKMLLKFLGNLRSLRDSHDTVKAGSSETVDGELSSVVRIISECESALTLLNRDLGILSTSIARERGELTS
ncbi:hypothetical protein KSS87_001653 [Heliosperma pusillum]|nr:hypothetical protein KSS87_001653 [Heliosperma pusillum]